MKSRTAWPEWVATCLAVIVGLLMVVYLSPAFWKGGMTTDVDSQMRIAFLEWSMRHGHLRDYLFTRDGAPWGMLLHWTLPYDLLAVAVAAPFAIFQGWHLALLHAADIAGPLSFLAECAAVAALCRAAGLGRATAWAIFVLASATSIVGYTGIGRLTHHGITATFGTMALASAISLCRRGRPRDGIIAACWMVLAAWESIEIIPALLVAWGVVMTGVALRPSKRDGFLVFGLALLPIAIGVLIVDPDPLGFFAASIDRFSAYHLVLFGVLALCVVAGVHYRARMPRFMRPLGGYGPVIWMGLLSVVPLAAVVVLGGLLIPPSLSTDLIMHFYMHMSENELKPAWDSPALFNNAIRPGGFIFLILVFHWFRRIRTTQGVVWFVVLMLIGAEFVMGVRFARLVPYVVMSGSVVLGATLRRWTSLILSDRRGSRTTIVLCIILCVTIAYLVPMARASWATITGKQDLTDTCVIGPEMARQLQAILPPHAIVEADLWFSPEVLARTNLRTVAGPFHRNVSGIHDVALTFADGADFYARFAAAKRGVVALLACTLPIRSMDPVYDDKSLERRLAAGQVPDWLVKVPHFGEGRFGLYLVKRPKATSEPHGKAVQSPQLPTK